MPVPELQKFREKYPDYGDLDDATLAGKLATKYPDAYGDLPGKVAASASDTMPRSMGKWKEIGGDILHGAETAVSGFNKGLADIDGMPVDVVNAALGAVGLGTKEPIGGSKFIKKVMPAEVKPQGYVENTLNAIGEQTGSLLPSMLIPGASTMGLVKTALGAGVGSGAARTFAPDSPLADMAAQMFGAVGPGGISRVGNKVTDLIGPRLAERLYGSSTRMPLSKKWLMQLPGEEIGKRTRAVREGLKSEVPPSEYGAQKAKNISSQSKAKVESIIDQLTSQGKTIDTDALLQAGLGPAYEVADASNTPSVAKAYVDEWAKVYRGEQGATMTPRAVQNNKLFNQKQSQYSPSDTQSANRQIGQAISKGMAHQAMLSLEELHPELKNLSRNSAAYHDLEEAITKAYSREGNTNIAKLGTKALAAGAHPILAVMDHVLGLPRVKAQLAFSLERAKGASWIRKSKQAGVIGEATKQAASTLR